MPINKPGLPFIKTYTLLLLLLFLVSPCVYALQTNTPEWKRDLIADINKANKLYAVNKSSLTLATDILESSAFYRATNYYRLAHRFYFYSIKNSSFNTNSEALKTEAHRIMPLLDKDERENWEALIEQQDNQLVTKISRFWFSQDPVISTLINERLIEHWYRIGYSKKHFNRNTHSPYGTDDRGTIFVQYGPPDVNRERSIHPRHVLLLHETDNYSYDLTDFAEEIEFTLWQYYNADQKDDLDQYYLFGEKHGRGEFGLQKNPVELINFDAVDLATVGSPALERGFRKLLVYKLFQELSMHNTYYNNQYAQMQNHIFFANSNIHAQPRAALQPNRGKLKMLAVLTQPISTFAVGGQSEMKHQHLLRNVSSTTSNLLDDKVKLQSKIKTFRFLNEDNKPEYAVAIKPTFPNHTMTPDTNNLLLNTSISSYQASAENIKRFEQTYTLSTDSMDIVTTHTIGDSLAQPLYYSMEVLDSSQENVMIPAPFGVNPLVKWATGQQEFQLPEPLSLNNSLTVSDVIIGKSQQTNFDERIPLTASFDNTFKPKDELIIFFEAYNIPASGYQYKYHFEKKRLLFGNKAISAKPSITILREEARKLDRQLFSIDLTDLKPAEYELVIEFSSLNKKSTTPVIEKRIDLTVAD